MTNQPTNQITPYQKTKSLLASDEIKERFNQVMGTRSGAFIASILNTVYLNDNLRDCEPNSILTSALTAAVLDLPIDPNLGFSYLIPYKDHGSAKARFQMGYKGYIQLAMRSGQYSAINVTEIYTGEVVRVDRLTGKVVLNGHRNGNDVIGYVAYFRLLNGFEKFLYMTAEEITAHAEKFSQSYKYDSSIWHKNFDAMAKKTVLKALISKYGIMSVQIQNVMSHEEPVADEQTNIIDLPEPEPPVTPETETVAFDPVKLFVDELISENAFAAKGLLAKAPAEIKANREALLKWGKIYRGWRDNKAAVEIAIEKANAGEVPA